MVYVFGWGVLFIACQVENLALCFGVCVVVCLDFVLELNLRGLVFDLCLVGFDC